MEAEAQIGIGLGVIAAVAIGGYLIYEHFQDAPPSSALDGAGKDVAGWLLDFYNKDLTEKDDPDRCKLVLNSPEVTQEARDLANAIDTTDANWFENFTSHWGAGIHGFFVSGLFEGQGVSSEETATQNQKTQALLTLKNAIVKEIEQCDIWNKGVNATDAAAANMDLVTLMEARWEGGQKAPYFTQDDITTGAKNHNLTSDAISALNQLAVYLNSNLINRGAPAPEYSNNAGFQQLSAKLLRLAMQYDASRDPGKDNANNGTYTPLRCYMIFIECQKLGVSDAAKEQLMQGVSALCGDARGATSFSIGSQRALYEFEDDARGLIDGWASAGAAMTAVPYGEYSIYHCLFIPMGPVKTLSYNDWGDLTRRVLSYQAQAGLNAAGDSWWRLTFGDASTWDTSKTVDGSGYWMPVVSYKGTYGKWDPNYKPPI